MSDDSRISEMYRYAKHLAYTTGGAVKHVVVKLNPFTKEDKTFLTVLACTVVAIGGVIALRRLVEHMKPLETPVVPATPVVPPPLVPAQTTTLGLHNGTWGWHKSG